MEIPPETCFFEHCRGYIGNKSSACRHCDLCQLDVPFAEWSSHENEEMHMAALKELNNVAADQLVLYKRRMEALSWESRISMLPRTSTQGFYRAMLDYVTDCSTDSTAVTVPLERCEAIERAALANLVVWKAMCIMSVPRDMTFPTVLDCHAWTQSGWKLQKAEMRECNSVKAIVSMVSFYLDGSKCKGKAKKDLTNDRAMSAKRIDSGV
jgi:hypothetical protein